MELRQLAYFMHVYETGSISKGARKANVAQPAMSNQIRRLEEELGTELLLRHANGVNPTVEGHEFFRLCVDIFKEISNYRVYLDSEKTGAELTGDLRLGIPPTLGRSVLAGVLSGFVEDCPRVRLSVFEGYTGTLAAMMEQGELDCALCTPPLDSPTLRQQLIYTDRVVLISRSPVNGADGSSCDLSNLRDLSIVIPSARNSFGQRVGSWLQTCPSLANRVLEVDGYETAIGLVRSHGWTALTPFLGYLNMENAEGMYAYPVVNPELAFRLHLLYDNRRPLGKAGRLFLNRLITALDTTSQLWEQRFQGTAIHPAQGGPRVSSSALAGASAV